MTNNENKTDEITTEQDKALYEQLGDANYHYLKNGNWLKEFTQFALQQSQSALGEKQNEVDNLNKRLYDASKDNSKLIADLTTKDKEIEVLAVEIFGQNSATEAYKNWVEGAKWMRSKLKSQWVSVDEFNWLVKNEDEIKQALVNHNLPDEVYEGFGKLFKHLKNES